MKLLYGIINKVFGTFYGVDARYDGNIVVKRRKEILFPKLRGLVELCEDKIWGVDQTYHTKKLYFSKFKIKRINTLMRKVDKEYGNLDRDLSSQFPQASKRPFREFPQD